jgi:hypothetical protein
MKAWLQAGSVGHSCDAMNNRTVKVGEEDECIEGRLLSHEKTIQGPRPDQLVNESFRFLSGCRRDARPKGCWRQVEQTITHLVKSLMVSRIYGETMNDEPFRLGCFARRKMIGSPIVLMRTATGS